MQKKFFITTPIYYANDIPHIGNSYASFICDVLARYKRLLGYEVKFSTGTDENSQKILLKAQEENISVLSFLENMAMKHKAIRDELEISYTDFIRTTDSKHVEFVQKILQKVYDKTLEVDDKKKDIYQGEYSGLYCIGCESFKKKEDLTPDGLCPDHLKKPENLIEKNRFFRLSNYQKKLEEFYEKNPNFVIPAHRFNEVKAFVKAGLEDFSISRETNKFGIPIPFSPDQVTYIRYDALLNYLTVCQQEDQLGFWPADYHVMAKDIVKFHAIYRPAMLMSAGYEPPKHCLVTGFFTIDGQKISKSLGNVIRPTDIIKKTSRDALVLYFLYDLIIGNDGDFSQKRLLDIQNSMLVGGRGNLINRVTKLAEKNGIQKIFIGVNYNKFLINVSDTYKNNKLLKLLRDFSSEELEKNYLDNNGLQDLVRDRYGLVQFCNEFMQKEEPWNKIKDHTQKENGLNDLKFLLYMIKNLAILSAPLLINGFEKIKTILGTPLLENIDTKKTLSGNSLENIINTKEFSVNIKPENIYEKVEFETEN